jgi:hypothetical protein
VPTVDHHDHIFAGEGRHISFAWLFLGFHVPGEGPHEHEVLRRTTVPKLVLDGVCVVRAGLLEESLDVVCRQPHMALDAVPSGRNALHVEAVHMLPIVIITTASGGSGSLTMPLSTLLGALDILHVTLDGDAGRRHCAAVGDHFPAT